MKNESNNSIIFQLIDEHLKRIEETIALRNLATVRLKTNEFWLQTINIYYSCFTAILALLSLKEGADFLTVPSAIFTVTVAILVAYANALKYGSRANDLRANCYDLMTTQTNLYLLKNQLPKTLCFPISKSINITEIQNTLNEYVKNLAGSENHSIIDEWKHDKNPKYFWFHILPLSALIFLFFMIPIIFLIWKHTDFIQLINNTQI